MILYYTAGYHSPVVRFLHSLFIKMPLTIWFRWLSLVTFWQKETFVNYTELTDAQLLTIWNTAAQGLATQPIPLSTNGTATHPADSRALTITPTNVAVVSMPDWTVADLTKVDSAWAGHSVPTGAFAIDAGIGYETVHGVTLPWTRPRVYGATSVLASVLVWEFQNVILSKLGYDVSNR